MDDIAPTASNPAPISVQCIADVPAPDVLVVIDEADNCQIPTVAFVSDVSDNQSCPETITRTYSVTDDCNNSILVTQSIIVMDDIAPTASSPATISVQCIEDVPAPDVLLITDEADNCQMMPTVAFVSDVSDNQSCPETITRTYSVTDTCDNTLYVTHTILVQDTIAPELLTVYEPEIFVYCDDLPDVPELEFFDNCSTDLSVTYFEEINQINDYAHDLIRTWIVSDNCDNSNTFKQTIFVRRTGNVDNQSIILCIIDDPIDLELLISNTPYLDGQWTSSTLDLLDGTVFDPADAEVGEFTFTYMYFKEECIWETIFTISVNDDCISDSCINSIDDVTISKLVTPNSDGYNDYFEVNYVLNQDDRGLCDVYIDLEFYNRWGVKVYNSPNYNNDWSGISTGGISTASNKLPAGTYFYIVKLVNSGLDPIQGFILLGTE
jgi:gliding motility-associated-like protein